MPKLIAPRFKRAEIRRSKIGQLCQVEYLVRVVDYDGRNLTFGRLKDARAYRDSLSNSYSKMTAIIIRRERLGAYINEEQIS